MILVTGGLGFIGAHTARALLDLGESCVVTQRREAPAPAFLADEIGKRVLVENLDGTDRAALLELGSKHRISGIVHLAAPVPGAGGTIEFLGRNTQALLNALTAATEWDVGRISIASSVGAYIGVPGGVFREDAPLPQAASHPIPVFKKAAELFSSLVAETDGLDVVHLRISTIWGPLGDPASPYFALPNLVQTAVRGIPLEQAVYAEDAADLCYVKDCARGIALLQQASNLQHRTYNIADGRLTTNAQLVAALGTDLPLEPGRRDSGGYLDISRINADTGYVRQYGIEKGLTDYVQWLSAGHAH